MNIRLEFKLPIRPLTLRLILSILRSALIFSLLVGLEIMSPRMVRAAGPDLGNLTYNGSELFTKISTVVDTAAAAGQDGHGNVAMFDGYLVTIYTTDGGGSAGDFAFWNVSNPRAPVKVVAHNPSNSKIREPHGFGFTNSYPGKKLVALQSTSGFQIWDWNDIFNPVLVKDVILPGIIQSDYSDGAWWLHWQAPYVYVAGSSKGLFVVDMTDLTNPIIRKTMTNSQLGIPRINQVQVIGNLMVVNYVENGQGVALLDISDPVDPILKYSNTTGTAIFYSTMFNGGKLAGAGKTTNQMYVYNVNFGADWQPSGITQIGSPAGTNLSGGGYLTWQDGFIFSGFSSKVAQFDARGSTISMVNSLDPNVDANEDIDFGTVLGNLIFAGNDHGHGSAFIVHHTAPDMTGPSVNFVSPLNNAVNRALTSRVGVTFSDQIDLRTVSSSTFIVRPVGGAALPGKYSHQFGVVNFFPDVALQANTTYEVVVTAGGIKDYVGNTVPSQFFSRFSTGPTIGTGPAGCNIGTDTPANVSATINFSATNCTGTSLQYKWSWGDGSADSAYSTSSAASHTYSNPGHYSVIMTAKDSGNQTASFSRIQTAIYPVTTNKPTRSSTIVFDNARARVHVVNTDANTVTSLNAAPPFTKQWEQPVGRHPTTLALASNGDLWVVNQDDATISVLNGGTGALITTITTLPFASRPYGIAISPSGSFAYVTLEGTGRLLRFDTSTRGIVNNLDIGPKPRGVAISDNGSRIFVTRFISPGANGEVREVNGTTVAFTRTFNLVKDATTPSTEADGPGLPNYMQAVTISPDGRWAWVPSKKDNISRETGPTSDGTALTFETTVRTIVSKLDLVSNTESFTRRRDINNSDLANAVVFNGLGDYAYVTTQGNNHVEIYDALSHNAIAAINNTGNAPQGLVLNADSSLLFVQNFMSRDIAVYNVTQVGKTNQITKIGGNVSTVSTESLSSQVLLGKKIFYNAGDARMSRDAYISCATCHLDGDSDGQTWDFTQRGEGVRNTINLLGRGGVSLQGRVHWTANFDEIQDFENDIRNAFGGTGFMTTTDFNNTSNPLGAPKAGKSTDLDALVAYVSSLNTVHPSPFRNIDGTLTPDGMAGKALFESPAINCIACHSGAQKTDSITAPTNPLHNVGTITAASGKRINGTLTGFDTPSLIGVWETAPYLHDGSAPTLLDVLTTKNPTNQHGTTSQLNATQKNQLVAYLLQLDNNDVPVSGDLITSIQPQDSANAVDWSRQVNLQAGNTAYGDRTVTFTTVPPSVAGQEWIRTANDSKSFTGNPLVRFTLTRPADVYVAWCDCQARPAWLDATWVDSGENLVTSATTTTERNFSLYRKNFAAGQVALGPYGFTTGYVYTVIAKETGGALQALRNPAPPTAIPTFIPRKDLAPGGTADGGGAD